MRFGLDVPTTGEYAAPHALADLAVEAEAAGWNSFLLWDVLLGNASMSQPIADPWIALAETALRTSRIRIGILALPLARHRPWLVARRLAALDQLSSGRMICAVGLGHLDRDFSAFGEASELALRAHKVDEGLAILDGLWRNDSFSFAGDHYTLDNVRLLPRPLQAPRIPLWVAAGWPHRAPMRRAARWDGICLKSRHAITHKPLAPADLRDSVAYVREHRSLVGIAPDAPFEIVMSGESSADVRQGADEVAPYAEAGATWWMEEGLGWTRDEFRQRIHSGPPRI
ncbi:MAG: LLM class flavin-dependent oxidoreductase [Ktedonobacterales bacterium]